MTITEFFNNLSGGARWDVGVSINRSNSLPLDANSVFSSLEAAQKYAAGNPEEGTLANAYPGQVLAVVTETETVIYYIDANMALQPVGNTKDVMAYIGEIPEGNDAKTIIEYINAKTSGIATDAALGELQLAVKDKVDKVEGKGLSTNDLTDELKANYDAAYAHSQADHAPVDAQANVIESVKVNGEALEVADKAVDITVPTKVSDLEQDIAYLTEHQDITGKADKATTLAGYGITDAYTAEEVDSAVQGAKDYAKDLVDAIPAQTDYSVSISEDTTDSSVAKRYIFTQLGQEIGRIDLAKELVVTSGTVKTVAEVNVPYAGGAVGDKYIELVIANQEAPIYIPVKDLVDVYSAAAGATEVQVAISNSNEISATLVDGGITEAKLAADVKEKLNKVYEEVGVAEGLVNALANGKVNDNALAIAAINHETDGILATANAYAKGLNDDVVLRVIELEKVDHDHANKDLLDTYTQTEYNLAAAVAKMHEHENADVIAAITAEKVAAWDNAERNVIAAVDATQFAIDADRTLAIIAVDQAKVTGLTDDAGNAITLKALLENKVNKNGTDRLISEAEAAKLELLVIDEETGQAAISGTVNASQVQGLADMLNKKVDKVDGMGLSANNLTNELLAKLNGIEAAAQVNVIEGITFNGVSVSVGEDKIADLIYALPTATADVLGGVKSSSAENAVSVAADGTMSVNSINVNNLVQTAGDVLIMNGGTASTTAVE